MKFPIIALLLACGLLSGCTLLGKLGQVIVNPSIAVGEPGDQLSQFSLSLHASPTVNPNASSVPIDTVDHSTPIPGPFNVHLSGADQLELVDKLQLLLQQIEQDLGYPPASTSPIAPPAQQNIAALGQYSEPLTDIEQTAAPAPSEPERVATPLAFKVLQLRDDSLLLNASHEWLQKDLKKALGSTYISDDDYILKPGQFKFVELQPIHEHTRYIAVIAAYHDLDSAQWKQVMRIQPRGRTYALLMQFTATGAVLKGEDDS
jgi:type VI secretion system VasD/TssJ family lipoprotein